MKHELPNEIHLEPQEISTVALGEKYAKGQEQSQQDVRRRVARALAANEQDPAYWEQVFFSAQEEGFVPAGRINSAAGTNLTATLINCFAQPVGDAISGFENGKPGIYPALEQAAETMRRGGGVGYNFSELRPKGAWVKGTDSCSSGPVSYMRTFNMSCETVESAGSRRGAQMAVLNMSHPDIVEFIHAKRDGSLTNFNMSIGVPDSFMQAVEADAEWELFHKAEPRDKTSACQRADGMWVYRKVRARELWGDIMKSTYNHGEPGILFLDRINSENNLGYIEYIDTTNPCAEQPLPPYGCCCLGSVNLVRYVRAPFSGAAQFDFKAFTKAVRTGVRMLDNVLDVTVWPLQQQKDEAQSKRRIGLGFLGLGDALVMLGLRYDSEEGRAVASKISEVMRDAAYTASVELAKEKGAFPLFDAEKFLESGFAKRLSLHVRGLIREHGLRNSHLVSIAPTGTITLAFADNASNGIEPAFQWSYTRNKRTADGSIKAYDVEDHAYRVFKAMGGDTTALPAQFVAAQEMAAIDHLKMVAAVAPFIDSAISKTVNVPEDYPFSEFEGLYTEAWRMGLKGLATYRPNPILGAVLEVKREEQKQEAPVIDAATQVDPDRRLRITKVPEPALASLRWPGRPKLRNGNPAWTYMVEGEDAGFAVFVGHVENGRPHPFEVWVNGAEQPRALGAVAKTLSMDMRCQDRAWLKMKLEALAKTKDDKRYTLEVGDLTQVFSSASAALARVVSHRVEELGVMDPAQGEPTPVFDALLSLKEPKAGTDGTMAWFAEIINANTGDDCRLSVKEIAMPDGSTRPISIWLSGDYPRELDGLFKLLSIDMRVLDPAWIGMKLRKLLSYQEPNGNFFAKVPGSDKSINWPSTVAYIARLLIHRYEMLGILDSEGQPINAMGVMVAASADPHHVVAPAMGKGMLCPSCHTPSYHKRDGCGTCEKCGFSGNCG